MEKKYHNVGGSKVIAPHSFLYTDKIGYSVSQKSM